MDFLLDPTVKFGDNSANRISPISGFGVANRVVFNMGGSGAIDNLAAEVVPEPASLLVWGGLAAVGRGFARRRRRVREKVA